MATFKINNIDISNDVLLNTFSYMKRLDDVFGTGSFSFESKTIDYNIAPYSVLIIDNDYFLCNSEATYHYGNKTWIHNVSTIEATSVLSRFLVGSKAFSITGTNTYDYEKINILLKLINQKYKVNISFDTEDLETIFNKQIEYVFTAGTTLFDALNEIVKNYNYRIYVSKIEDKKIYIKYIDLENMEVLEISDYKLLSKTKTQNPENYCKYLESEVNNVVDTTNISLVDNIFPTASDIKLSEETYMLKLPTPIYKIKSFWANLDAHIEAVLIMPSSLDADPAMQSYELWSNTYPILKDIYDVYFAKYLPNWEKFKTQEWYRQGRTLIPYGSSQSSGIIEKPIYKVDLTWRLKSKEQYDLIEDKDKPDYIYYTLGNNVIDGFNVFYKNDFWNTLIGQTKKPFFLNMGGTVKPYQGEIYEGVEIAEFKIIADNDIFKATYGGEYYSLSNLLLVNVKKDTPENEKDYKPYALSYGKSSNYVDFDKISNSMEIENQSVGKVEKILEYDITGESFLYDYKKIIFEGKEWYVSNAQYKMTSTQNVVTLNLVSNYNKVADIVSLNSQYNTTKNPLQDIIERPVYIESTQPFSFNRGKSYFVVTFEFADGKTIDLLFSPIVLTQNEDTYFYFEMEDQYNAKNRAVNVQDSTQIFKVESVPYVDSNNEVVKCSLKRVDLENINYEIAKNLPLYKNWMIDNPFYQTISNAFFVYKDAREKLTFTIKANACIIK